MNMIRAARPDDAAQMLDIYRPYILETPITFESEVPSVVEMQTRIADTLAKYPWLVCEVDEQVVGYAYAGTFRTRSAYSWSLESALYVQRDFQGRGIGVELYERLFSLLKAQGAVNVIGCITLPNAASVRIHEKLGFSKVAHMKEVGFKHGQWWDVGFWQLQLQQLRQPSSLRAWSSEV